jgi:hypothetical protein
VIGILGVANEWRSISDPLARLNLDHRQFEMCIYADGDADAMDWVIMGAGFYSHDSTRCARDEAALFEVSDVVLAFRPPQVDTRNKIVLACYGRFEGWGDGDAD